METAALKKMTVAQLRDEARKIPGVTGLSGMKKDELVALVASHQGSDPPATSSVSSGGTKKTKSPHGARTATPDRAQLKQRIRELKAEKQQALTGRDVRKTRECNREIHRCKRTLRKLARLGS